MLLAKQVGFDVFVHLPFLYLPSFYVVKESVAGSGGGPVDWVTNAADKYTRNWMTDVKVMTQVWLPADIICFTVPMWLRLPIRHAIRSDTLAPSPAHTVGESSSRGRRR